MSMICPSTRFACFDQRACKVFVKAGVMPPKIVGSLS